MSGFRSIGRIAAGMVGGARARSVALQKFRSGEEIGLTDKIADLGCMHEIEGFEDQLRRDGVVLTEAERAAIWARKADFMAGRGPNRKHGA